MSHEIALEASRLFAYMNIIIRSNQIIRNDRGFLLAQYIYVYQLLGSAVNNPLHPSRFVMIQWLVVSLEALVPMAFSQPAAFAEPQPPNLNNLVA